MQKENQIVDKSFYVARWIVRIYKYLCETKREYILSKQLLRSGTSIGANIHEAIRAQSRADFFAKMYIALKESSETEYWLKLLFAENYLPENDFNQISVAVNEIICILVKITKKQKEEKSLK